MDKVRLEYDTPIDASTFEAAMRIALCRDGAWDNASIFVEGGRVVLEWEPHMEGGEIGGGR